MKIYSGLLTENLKYLISFTKVEDDDSFEKLPSNAFLPPFCFAGLMTIANCFFKAANYIDVSTGKADINLELMSLSDGPKSQLPF